MKILKGLVLAITVLTLISGCSDSDMVSDFERAKEWFGKRLGNEEKTTEKGIELRKWYSWNFESENQGEKVAADGTTLIEAKVLNVIDGDTIDVKITNGKEERVRFILINTPESKGKYEKNPQPYAIPAYEFTKSMLLDRTIWLEKGIEERDQYGRLLAYIWLDNVVLNEEVESEDGEVVILGEKIGFVTLNELLLREGLAQVAIYPPNTKYVDEFEAVQKQAKKDKKGMWAE